VKRTPDRRRLLGPSLRERLREPDSKILISHDDLMHPRVVRAPFTHADRVFNATLTRRPFWISLPTS